MTLIGLRLNAGAALGWGLFLGVFAFIEVFSYGSMGTGPDHRSIVAQFQGMGNQTSYLVDLPHRLDLLAGYIQWFLVGFFGIFYSVWALIAGTGATRGDEEKGLVEAWFASGVSPYRLVFARLAAFTVAAGLSALAVVGLALLLARLTNQRLPAGGSVLQVVNQMGAPVAVFAFAMLLAQLLPTRRNALGVGGLVLGALVLLNGFSRTIDWLQPYRWISPFAYADFSHAMTPGVGVNLAAMAVPYLEAVLLATLAAYLNQGRDLGSAFFRVTPAEGPPVRDASANLLLAVPALNVLWEQRVGLAVWTLAIGAYAVSNVPLAKPFNKIFGQGSSADALQAKVAFGFSGKDPLLGFISQEWMQVACLVVSAYAITQVARWAADDAEGRLEMLLSTGLPRWRVVLERALALAAAAVVIALGNVVGVLLGGQVGGIGGLRPVSVLGASLLFLPVVLAVGGIGAAVAAVRPRLAMGILILVIAAGYLVPLLGVPIFHKVPPAWFLDLSIFQLYGSPLVDGIYWRGTFVLAAVIVAGFGAALLLMRRRDVGS
jgi:ABC-2 type transport system permease protein